MVVCGGSAIALNWAQQNADAILYVWYPGEEGGNAVADVLFGDYNPAGRLPVTFYKWIEDIPDFRNYDMEGRTYRFFRKQPLYPFGYGLSYSTFAYDNPIVAERSSASDPLEVSVAVTNTGKVAGDEVVQLYVSDVDVASTAPIRELKAFARIAIAPGETRRVRLSVAADKLLRTAADGTQAPIAGRLAISVGGGQPGTGTAVVTRTVERTS